MTESMCANYTPPPPRALRAQLACEAEFDYAEEVYPGDAAPIVVLDAAERWSLIPASFGLRPPWAKAADFARYTYNARSETVAEKPSFRQAWARRQYCLIPVARFFEPNYEGGVAVRWAIERVDQSAFLLAGLWEQHLDADRRPAHSFTLLTINAADDPLMRRFHAPEDEKRAVVVLDAQQSDAWLHARGPRDAASLLQAWDSSAFQAQPAPRQRSSAKKSAGVSVEKAAENDQRQGRLFD